MANREKRSCVDVIARGLAAKALQGGGGGGGGTSDHRQLSNRNAANQHPISAITGLADIIPEQASADNPLTDKNFVNSSIGTNTAYYISDNGQPFASLAALQAYTGTVTNNDYAFVIGTDGAGNTIYTRYKYNAEEEAWAEEYVLNNSSFTAAQWAAINSGTTAELVSDVNFMLNYGLVYDTGGGINITWDGSTEGRDSINTGAMSLYNVSNSFLSTNDLVGCIITFSDGETNTISPEWVIPFNDDVIVIGEGNALSCKAGTYDAGEGWILTIPSDGIYFGVWNSGADYVTSITKPSNGKLVQNGEDVTQEVEEILEQKSTRFTLSTTAPTADISDGGIHIVVLSEEPTAKYNGYIYLIEEA